uniref:GntR-family transcriptional regulator n=1 Tax=Vibrio phage Vc1 TaxID=1480731 RepID=A0A6M5CB42_9CAUD
MKKPMIAVKRAFVGGYGWRIQREGDITFADIKSNNFQPNAYVDTLNELREILRVPKGENIVKKPMIAVKRAFVGGYGWRIQREGDITFADIKSNNFQPNAYVDTLNELREILRVPKGENIVTHAKVVRALADALISLQK